MPIRFVDIASRRAQLIASLGGASASISGTHVAPPNRTGVLQPQLQGAGANLQGIFTNAPNRTGAISAALSGVSAQVSGTFVASTPFWTSSTVTLNLTAGTPYSLDLSTLCTGAVSFQILSGALPAGLSQSGSSGNIISGTPTTSGTSVVTFQASDTFLTFFPANESPISQGGIWQRGLAEGGSWNNPLTTAGRCVATVAMPAPSRYSDDIAHLKTSFLTYTPNQYAEATAYKLAGYTGSGGSHEIELLLRFSITNGVAIGYEVLWGIQGYIAVVHWNGPVGSYTPIYDPGVGSIAPYVDGDVLRAEIVGTTITVKRNGVPVAGLSSRDLLHDQGGNTVPAINSGQPGLGFWPADGGVPGNAGWKSFEAGNL